MRKGQKTSLETKLKMMGPRLKMIGNKNGCGNKGKIRTSEMREKMVETAKRIGIRPPVNYMFNEKNPAWKGDKAGYIARHHWIIRRRGKAIECENCGKRELVGKKIHWSNISRQYKRIISDWQSLCASCHKKYDIKTIKKH